MNRDIFIWWKTHPGFDYFTQCKHHIASMTIRNKHLQDSYEAASQTAETKMTFSTIERLKGEQKAQLCVKKKEWKCPTQFHRDRTSWNQPKTQTDPIWNNVKPRKAAKLPIEKLKLEKTWHFFPDKWPEHQLLKSLLIHFLSVDQLCRYLSPWSEHVWRRSAHSLPVKHHSLKHTPVSRPRGQSEAESDGATEATCDSPTTAKVRFPAVWSKIYDRTFKPPLEVQERGRKRHVYEHTAALQAALACIRPGGGWGGKCLRRRLTTGF